jgi:hypothetical protein
MNLPSASSNVDVIEGLDGVRVVFDDVVQTGGELVAWGATDRARQLLPEFTEEYIRRREQHNVRARQLAVEGSAVLETPYSKFKYIPREYSSPATTLIYGNKVAIMMWFSDPVVSIRITSREIADAYRNHFEFLWNTKLFTFEEVFASTLVQNEIKKTFEGRPYEVITRKTSFVLRLRDEPSDHTKRIILLPPGGTTAGDYSGVLPGHDRFSPHPEALKAKVAILGGVAPGRLGYRKIDRGIRFSYFLKRDADLSDATQYREEYKSSHTPPFAVVKPNGFGFWHALANTGNEWAVLILEKELISQQPLRFEPALAGLSLEQKRRIRALENEIVHSGDHIFERSKDPLAGFSDIKPDALARILIALLNAPEGANHEQCTAVALLLKLAKKSRDAVVRSCERALKSLEAPAFYLEDILRKLER